LHFSINGPDPVPIPESIAGVPVTFITVFIVTVCPFTNLSNSDFTVALSVEVSPVVEPSLLGTVSHAKFAIFVPFIKEVNLVVRGQLDSFQIWFLPCNRYL
jgi:hypothetical protein